MFGTNLDDIDIDGRDANGEFPDGYGPWGRSVDKPDVWAYTPKYKYPSDKYPYKFESEEALMTSQFFQDALAKSLKFKNEEIDRLREEIMTLEFKGWLKGLQDAGVK